MQSYFCCTSPRRGGECHHPSHYRASISSIVRPVTSAICVEGRLIAFSLRAVSISFCILRSENVVGLNFGSSTKMRCRPSITLSVYLSCTRW